MATNLESLIVKLDADVRDYTTKMDQAQKKTTSSTKSMEASFNKVKVGILAVGAAAVAGTAILAKYGDAYTRIQNRIRTVIDPSQDLATVTKELLTLSNDTRSSLDATSELYAKLKRNTDDLNLSNDELLEVTGLINKAFAISGATAAETAGSVRQLAQAFAAGALRGDEFNSVAEGAPVIMEAVAFATGKTKGELRELAAEGKITSEVLIESLQNYSSVINGDFAKANITIEQSQEKLNNNFTVMVGELDKVIGFSEGAAGGIDDLAESLDYVGDLLVESIKDFQALGSILDDEIGGGFDQAVSDIQEFSKEYEQQLNFLSDLFNAFAFSVKTGVMTIAVLSKSLIQGTIAVIVSLFAEGRIKILEFRKFINEVLGDDAMVSALEAQIIALQETTATNLAAQRDAVAAQLEEISTLAIDADKRLAEERLKILDERLAAEEQALLESLERRQEAKAALGEGGTVELGDDENGGKTDSDKELEDIIKNSDKWANAIIKNEKKVAKEAANAEKAKVKAKAESIKLIGKLGKDGQKIQEAFMAFDQARATASILIDGAVGAEKAIAQLGVPGIAVAAGILAAAATLSSSAGSVSPGDTSIGASAPSIATSDTAFSGPTADVQVSEAGPGGSSTTEIRFAATAGDELGTVMTEWLNENIKKGRIGGTG